MTGRHIALRDLTTGRTEFEAFGTTPFADVPMSPYYTSSPGSRLSTRAWMDSDGQHVIAAHDCQEARVVHLLPWPAWQAVGFAVTPSYSCDDCGVHAFLTINAEEAKP